MSVNGTDVSCVESDVVKAWIRIRIKDYNGLPRGSPASSNYFDHRLHTSDRYSIAFSFVPKSNISGNDLVMGFDYDHSIKHQLPPGFKYAMKIATSLLDPGLYSDPYSDEPYLYGPALSSFFAFRIGELIESIPADKQIANLNEEGEGVIEEGADGSGQTVRNDQQIPSKWKKRRKYFLDAQALSNFTFEKGRMYHADFFNPHLDFANFSLRLPGFSISVAKYIDEKTHHLRFVLKNKTTEEVLFVVFFRLLFGKELDERLENEKTPEKTTSTAVAAKELKTDTTEHDDLETTRTGKVTSPSEQYVSSTAQPADGDAQSQSITDTATVVVSRLADSICAAYAALGIANIFSSSGSEASSRSTSPGPSSKTLDSHIDALDDATVEQYLQSRQGNPR